MPTASAVSVPRVHLAHRCRPWPATGAPALRARAGLLVAHRPTFVQIEVSPHVTIGVTVTPGAVHPDGTQDLFASTDDDRPLVTLVARLIHADADLRRGVRPRAARSLPSCIIPFPAKEVARVS